MLKKVISLAVVVLAATAFVTGCKKTTPEIAPTTESAAPETATSEVTPSESTPVETESASTPAETTSEEANAVTDGKFAEAYLKDNQAALDQAVEASRASLGTGGDIKIEAVGNELIYTFKYGKDIPTDQLGDTLKTSLEQGGAAFEAVADSIKTATNADKIQVTVIYLDANDKELAKKTFESK